MSDPGHPKFVLERSIGSWILLFCLPGLAVLLVWTLVGWLLGHPLHWAWLALGLPVVWGLTIGGGTHRVEVGDAGIRVNGNPTIPWSSIESAVECWALSRADAPYEGKVGDARIADLSLLLTVEDDRGTRRVRLPGALADFDTYMALRDEIRSHLGTRVTLFTHLESIPERDERLARSETDDARG